MAAKSAQQRPSDKKLYDIKYTVTVSLNDNDAISETFTKLVQAISAEVARRKIISDIHPDIFNHTIVKIIKCDFVDHMHNLPNKDIG